MREKKTRCPVCQVEYRNVITWGKVCCDRTLTLTLILAITLPLPLPLPLPPISLRPPLPPAPQVSKQFFHKEKTYTAQRAEAVLRLVKGIEEERAAESLRVRGVRVRVRVRVQARRGERGGVLACVVFRGGAINACQP